MITNTESTSQIINKSFDTLENKINYTLKFDDDYYPSNLYHRTNYYTNVGNILSKKKLIPSCLLNKKETYCATMSSNFVSLSEGKCNETGGHIQFTFDANKLLKKNKINCIFREMNPEDIFIHELEWRKDGIVNFEYDDIKEIVLYKNYRDSILKSSSDKRELTISHNYIQKLTKELGIKFRVVDSDSDECNKEERHNELIKILGKETYDKHVNKYLV